MVGASVASRASWCPLHCIIPPHMLREIARRGDPDQQAWAFDTLSLSEQLRGQRQVLGLFAPATLAGAKRRTIYDARQGEDLPGALVRGEGDPKSKDPAVNEAYDGSGATYFASVASGVRCVSRERRYRRSTQWTRSTLGWATDGVRGRGRPALQPVHQVAPACGEDRGRRGNSVGCVSRVLRDFGPTQ